MMFRRKKEVGHKYWYLPKLHHFKDFLDTVMKWIIKASAYIEDMPEPSTETPYSDVSAVSVGMI